MKINANVGDLVLLDTGRWATVTNVTPRKKQSTMYEVVVPDYQKMSCDIVNTDVILEVKQTVTFKFPRS